jgi:Protein of unknown function (DUF4242)
MEGTEHVDGAGWTTFLVEHYWPGVTGASFAEAARRVQTGAEELAGQGRSIRFLHSTLVPEEEAAFCVFAAASRADVVDAYGRAGVAFDRVLDAVEGRPAPDEALNDRRRARNG